MAPHEVKARFKLSLNATKKREKNRAETYLIVSSYLQNVKEVWEEVTVQSLSKTRRSNHKMTITTGYGPHRNQRVPT